MKNFSFHEFRPTVTFILKFICFYLIANLIYGIYITFYNPRPDPVTSLISQQTATVLQLGGFEVTSVHSDIKPTSLLIYNGHTVLSVYEGCNGLNTIIIFLAFIIAFGPLSTTLAWYSLFGILSIHLTNLARIVMLFLVAEYWPDFLYLTHKYFFTAVLYFVVFLIWLVWVRRFSFNK
jgi:exosortase family protein XrtF